jgi:hypothetical protein
LFQPESAFLLSNVYFELIIIITNIKASLK